jgi:hypothetical protein
VWGWQVGYDPVCVEGGVGFVGIFVITEAGTVLSHNPLWGLGRRSHAWSNRLSVSPIIGG